MLTSLDHLRITKLLLTHPYAAKVKVLEDKLKSSKIVESTEAPDDLVTMNSVVFLYDITLNDTVKVRLVYQLAPFQGTQASVLSPLGASLLGRKRFETFEYQTREGTTREVRVLDILFQPEREGNFEL